MTDAPTVPVLMLIDASGSMYALADDVRGGFNQYVDSLRAQTDVNYLVSVALFSYEHKPLVSNVAPADVPALTEANYHPRGGTALYDAVGWLVTETEVPEGARPLVVVNTDGHENSSHEWTIKALQSVIADKQKQGWEFVYLGAGISAWEGEQMGMRYSASTVNTREGTQGLYSGLATGTRKFSQGATGQAVMDIAVAESAAQDEAARSGQ